MLLKSIKCLGLIIWSILSQDCKSYQHLKTKEVQLLLKL